MEIEGRIIHVLPAREGVSKASGNPWKLQQFVLETHEQYPKKVMFEVFGADRLAQFNIQPNEELAVSFDIEAREYQGKWYNGIRAWAVRRIDPAAAAAGATGTTPMDDPLGAAPGPQAPFPAPAAPTATAAAPADDLPF